MSIQPVVQTGPDIRWQRRPAGTMAAADLPTELITVIHFAGTIKVSEEKPTVRERSTKCRITVGSRGKYY